MIPKQLLGKSESNNALGASPHAGNGSYQHAFQHMLPMHAAPAAARNGARPQMPQNYVPFIPENMVIQANGDNIDSLLQVHRRKMLRRAANRRSAQLSRARKKAYMEDLKVENARLQRLVDILDSQPELTICVNISGKITYISERTMNFVKVSNVDESSDEDPTHLNQVMTPESVETTIEAIKKLQKECANGSTTGSTTGSGCNSDSSYGKVSEVLEVSFNDENGYPTIGYMRCAKVVRRDIVDDSADMEENPPAKKSKKGAEDKDDSNNFNFLNSTLAGAMALQSLGKSISGQAPPEESIMPPESMSSSGQPLKRPEGEDEFICVIRPGHTSVPNNFYLSKASMVEHDINNSGVKEDDSLSSRDESGSGSGRNGEYSKGTRTTSEKVGTSGSDASTSTANKNSTSSEAGSEDNGNEEDSA